MTTKIIKEQSNQEDLMLLEQYKNGDEYAFNELYQKYTAMMHDVANKFEGNRLVEKEERLSFCNLAFMEVINTFDSSRGRTFMSFLYYKMELRVIDAIDYTKRKGRDKISKLTDSYHNTTSSNSGGTFEEVVLKSAEDKYFDGEYTNTQNIIDASMSKVKEELRPYIIPMLTKEIGQVEVGEIVGMSKQSIRYHMQNFIKHFKTMSKDKELQWAV